VVLVPPHQHTPHTRLAAAGEGEGGGGRFDTFPGYEKLRDHEEGFPSPRQEWAENICSRNFPLDKATTSYTRVCVSWCKNGERRRKKHTQEALGATILFFRERLGHLRRELAWREGGVRGGREKDGGMYQPCCENRRIEPQTTSGVLRSRRAYFVENAGLRKCETSWKWRGTEEDA
jgi:hypothetical protein